MSIPSQLSTQLLKLSICLGELAAEGLKEVKQVLCLDAACSKQLQCATLVAHHKMTFKGGSLPDDFIPGKHRIDSFAMSP